MAYNWSLINKLLGDSWTTLSGLKGYTEKFGLAYILIMKMVLQVSKDVGKQVNQDRYVWYSHGLFLINAFLSCLHFLCLKKHIYEMPL